MPRPDLFPALPLRDFALQVDANSTFVNGRVTAFTVPAPWGSDVALGWSLWGASAFAGNEAHFAADLLGLIEQNTYDAGVLIGDWGNALLDVALATEQDLKNFLAGDFLAALTAGGSSLDPRLMEIRDALTQAIAPNLKSLAGTAVLSNLTQQDAALLDATVTTESAALLANVIAGGLERLVEASKATGGLDIDEWSAALVPHSAPDPKGKVTATDNVSPWIKQPSGFVAFVLDRLAVMFRDFYDASDGAANLAAPVFTPLINAVVSQVEERATSLGEVKPGDAFPLARRFLVEAFTNGLKARIISIVLEKIGDQSKNLGVQQIAGLVGDLSGFSQLAEAIHGTQLQAAVARPAQYQINAQTRTRLLSPGETIDSATERKLSLDEQREILRFHGYTEHHIDVIQQTQWTDPRLREIVLLASDVSVNEDDIRHWLSEAGYDDNDIERITPVIVQQSLKSQRQSLTSEIMVNLREGYLTDEDAEAQFDRLRYTEEAKRMLLDTGRFGFRRELIAAHIAELEQMFQLEQIKEPEFRLALDGLGVRKEKIDAIVGKAFSKFIGRVSKEETAQADKDVRELQQTTLAALKAQFQAGLIPGETFFANLVAIGFLPQIAREIVALEQIKAFTKDAGEKQDEADRLRDEIRRARIAAFVELFQDGFIDEAQLRQNLLALGLAPELTDALVFREVAKKEELPKPPKTTSTQ